MIKRDIENFRCQLTPLTPIHIGSGEELSSCDYIIKKNQFFRISLEDFYEKLDLKLKKEFLELIENNRFISIRKFVKDNYKEEYGYLYKRTVSEDIQEKYESKIGGATKKNEENLLSVFEFIGNYKGKYIPGSSLKGYIRTAYIANESENLNYNIMRNSKVKTAPFVSGAKEGGMDKEISAKALGLNSLEPKFDPFKNITITDSNILSSAITLGEVERANNKNAPLPMGIHEVTKSLLGTGDNISFEFNLSIKNLSYDLSKKLIDLSVTKGESIIKEVKEIYMDTLFEALRDMSNSVLKDDIQFFKATNNRKCLESCEKILEYSKTLKDNEVLIRLGKGSGFNSKTLNLFNSRKKEVHTRVVVDGFPVGWGILSYIED